MIPATGPKLSQAPLAMGHQPTLQQLIKPEQHQDLGWHASDFSDADEAAQKSEWIISHAGKAEVAPAQRDHFLAGRYCAARAIALLRDEPLGAVIGRHDSGAPAWPAACIGSITHTDGYAAAVVGPTWRYVGIGIDAERIRDSATADEIRAQVLDSAEIDCARRAGMSLSEAAFLGFSAKESLYKCLHPQARRFFGFRDAVLEQIDTDRGQAVIALRIPLGAELPVGTRFAAKFLFAAGLIHTAILRCRTTAPAD